MVVGGASYRGYFGPLTFATFMASLTLNGRRTVETTVVGNVRPRVLVGVPDTAEAKVCPLLVGRSCEVPRWDANEARDRAVPAGVGSRLDARAPSFSLILFSRLEFIIEVFFPVVSDLEAEVAFLEFAVLRMIPVLALIGLGLMKSLEVLMKSRESIRRKSRKDRSPIIVVRMVIPWTKHASGPLGRRSIHGLWGNVC